MEIVEVNEKDLPPSPAKTDRNHRHPKRATLKQNLQQTWMVACPTRIGSTFNRHDRREHASLSRYGARKLNQLVQRKTLAKAPKPPRGEGRVKKLAAQQAERRAKEADIRLANEAKQSLAQQKFDATHGGRRRVESGTCLQPQHPAVPASAQ